MPEPRASVEWIRQNVEESWLITHATVLYHASLTHSLEVEGIDHLDGKWRWELHPAPSTLDLFAGAGGVCAEREEAMVALEAEATRVFELVEQTYGPGGPPDDDEF